MHDRKQILCWIIQNSFFINLNRYHILRLLS
jgi:hypothetical protein